MAEIKTQEELKKDKSTLLEEVQRDEKVLQGLGLAFFDFFLEQLEEQEKKIRKMEEKVRNFFDKDFRELLVKNPRALSDLLHELGNVVVEFDDFLRHLRDLKGHLEYIQDRVEKVYQMAKEIRESEN